MTDDITLPLDPESPADGLQRSAAYYKAIFEHAPVAFYLYDDRGVLVDGNQMAEALVGYSRQELIGSSLLEVDLVASDELTLANRRIRLSHNGREVGPECFHLRRKDGAEVPVEVRSYPIVVEGRTLTLGVARDISDRITQMDQLQQARVELTERVAARTADLRKANEELKRQISERDRIRRALEETTGRYRAVVQQSAECIFLVDPRSLEVLESNDTLRRLLGYSEEQMRGLLVDTFVENAVEDIEARYRAGSGSSRLHIGERRYKLPDGTFLDMDVNASPITYLDREVLCVVSRNITERKKTQAQLNDSLKKLQSTIEGTIQAFSAVVESRDPYTAGHQRRVAHLARSISRILGLGEDQSRGLYLAGLLHDIGKIYIPAEILSKPTELTREEFELIKRHPSVGYDIIKSIEFPWPIADIVLEHHERLDGSGYPRGLPSDSMRIEAKILSVADVVEAMASYRPYRPARGLNLAIEEITENSGRLYDTDVVNACLVSLHREPDFWK